MICPLMSRPLALVEVGSWFEEIFCRKEACALWVGQCAITAIAKAKIAEREEAEVDTEREHYQRRGRER